MKTRKQAILEIAITLSLARGFDWKPAQNDRQAERQAEFMRLAEKIVGQIEEAMKDFAWEPEP